MTIRTQTLATTAADGTVLLSHVALPDGSTPVAGILVAPEWWGVVEHPKSVAERLAQAGFAAAVMDVYGDGKFTTDAATANAWMTDALSNPMALMDRCARILADFAALPEVDSARIGVAGFCFGGKLGLDMARLAQPIKAVATFHGNPAPIKPAEKDVFTASVLVAHGAADSMVSMQAIDGLKDELAAADVRFEIDVYDNAKHGFSNPAADARAAENGVDLGYNEAAAVASWDKMVAFMRKELA
ncbi:dienelactone hydrolase [Moraxella caviae]|uniref:Dienelactone hydrolase n=1 Tax=Moraxella caviae TaxID=34060 RepID=A0A1T0A5A5_9GAMM|nr:dienelactone hydrolase family protein [Moraxella caviae]OOR90915.1 dienelactone hydrolase [Moraxella caviae]STZ10199.1 Predicted esterase [Moraxella caviae]